MFIITMAVVIIILEFVVESRLLIKLKLVRRFGIFRYIITVFSSFLLIEILLSVFLPSKMGNGIIQGIIVGLWIFSSIGLKKNIR